MNERQKIVLLAGFGVFFAMLAYCPWEVSITSPSEPGTGGWWCGGIVHMEQKTVYDWNWKVLQRQEAQESSRYRDTERLRWQIMIWALLVMLAFLRLHTEDDPSQVFERSPSPSQVP